MAVWTKWQESLQLVNTESTLFAEGLDADWEGKALILFLAEYMGK